MLNTLYVTTSGAYLRREGETIVVKMEGETKLRLPLRGLDGIVCLGRVLCSPQLMAACCRRNISISFFDDRGRFWARVTGPVSGNVLLRRQQYRIADDPALAAEIARPCVAAKIANCRTVLLRHLRDHPQAPGAEEVRAAARRMRRLLESLASPVGLQDLRGCEGEAALLYFSVLDYLILAQKPAFAFLRRTRRPPTDPFNALLSFLYSVLAHDAASALEGVGLDPAVGFLHASRPGRPSLALDLMEEFRPVLADRLALSLVNRQQVRSAGFVITESGAVLMTDKTRKTVISAYQERKREEIRHPFLDEKIPVGLLLHAQALLLARHIRGDLDGYPPFLWR